MNGRLVVIDLEQGEVGVTLGANYRYFTVAANSVISLDANSAAANTVAHVQIWALVNEA